MFNFINTSLAAELSMSSSSLSLMSSAYLYANAIWLLPGGMLLDKIRAKSLLVFFMLLCVISSFIFSVSSSISVKFFLRIIEGVGSAMSLLICFRMAHDWFPNKTSSIVGFIVSIGLLGGVYANTVFPLLVLSFDWRFTVFFNAVVGSVFLLMIIIFVKSPDKKEVLSAYIKVKDQYRKLLFGLKTVLINSENWKCGLYIGLMNLPIFVLAALWGNVFLVQYKGYSETAAGLLISLIFIGELIGAPVLGMLADRFNKKKIIMFFGAITSLFSILLIIFSGTMNFHVDFVLFIILGFAISAQVLAYPLLMKNNPAHIASTSTGFGSLLSNATGAFMQISFGALLTLKLGTVGIEYTEYSLLLAITILPAAFMVSTILASLLKTH